MSQMPCAPRPSAEPKLGFEICPRSSELRGNQWWVEESGHGILERWYLERRRFDCGTRGKGARGVGGGILGATEGLTSGQYSFIHVVWYASY